MNTTQRKNCADNNNNKWPQPVTFEYHDDLSEKKIKEIREAAGAPSETDPNWKTVDGPGW